MKTTKHLHTKFIKFLIERHLEDPDVDDEEERPLPDEESEVLRSKKSQKLNEFEDDEELPKNKPQQEDSEDGENDDDTIEQLLTEYKKLRRQYESRGISNRTKR